MPVMRLTGFLTLTNILLLIFFSFFFLMLSVFFSVSLCIRGYSFLPFTVRIQRVAQPVAQQVKGQDDGDDKGHR